jgi:O-antigen ligase
MATGRSGYVVFMALIALFCVQKMRLKGLLIASLSLVVLVGSALLFSGVFKARVNQAITEFKTYHATSQTSVGLRMGFVKNSLQLIKAHPIIGTGTGSFTTEYNQLNLPPELQIRNPHNEYLHIGVQFGIIGIVLLLTLFGMQLWFSRRLADPWQSIAQAVIVAIMVGSCANSWLLDMTAGHFYAYFIALTFASLKPVGTGRDLSVKSEKLT